MVLLELYDHQGYGKKQCKIQAYDTSETLWHELIVGWNNVEFTEVPQIYIHDKSTHYKPLIHDIHVL